MSQGFEIVTPKLAAAILARNEGNRSLRPAKVKEYAADMASDRWRHRAASPIMVHKDGKLMNGQHRLAAVIESGASVPMLIIYGCEDSDRAAIDVGVRRSTGDMATYLGCAGGSQAGAVLVWLYRYGSGDMRGQSAPSAIQMESMILAHKDRIGDVLGVLPSKLPMPRSMVGFIGLCVYGRAERLFCEFVHGIATGEGLAAGDARLTIRNHFLAVRARRDARADTLERIIRAWNAFATGRALSNSQPGRGAFPDIYLSEFEQLKAGAR